MAILLFVYGSGLIAAVLRFWPALRYEIALDYFHDRFIELIAGFIMWSAFMFATLDFGTSPYVLAPRLPWRRGLRAISLLGRAPKSRRREFRKSLLRDLQTTPTSPYALAICGEFSMLVRDAATAVPGRLFASGVLSAVALEASYEVAFLSGPVMNFAKAVLFAWAMYFVVLIYTALDRSATNGTSVLSGEAHAHGFPVSATVRLFILAIAPIAVASVALFTPYFLILAWPPAGLTELEGIIWWFVYHAMVLSGLLLIPFGPRVNRWVQLKVYRLELSVRRQIVDQTREDDFLPSSRPPVTPVMLEDEPDGPTSH